MLLCPKHHRQATAGALTEAEQRHWKDGPFNIQQGFVDGQLVLAEPVLAVQTLRVSFVGPFRYIVNGESIFTVEIDEAARMALSLNLFDFDDNLRFVVARNEWITGDPAPWDFEFGFRWLTLRTGPRRIPLRIDARGRFLNISADLWRSGVRLLFQGNEKEPLIESQAGQVKFYADGAIYVNHDIIVYDSGRAIQMRPRSPGGRIVVGSDLDKTVAEYLRGEGPKGKPNFRYLEGA